MHTQVLVYNDYEYHEINDYSRGNLIINHTLMCPSVLCLLDEQWDKIIINHTLLYPSVLC